MARITHVKRAQPRYPTRPVIDPATGQPKRTQVMRKDGGPKLTRAKAGRPGRPIYMNVTERVPGAPAKPLLTCDAQPCREPQREILLGTPYKHITPRSGPYGGRQRNRHEGCPNWRVWEYSDSLAARVAQIQSETVDGSDWAEESDAEGRAEELAAMVRELAEEKQGNLENMPDGLRDASELAGQVEDLESWAGEIEQALSGVEFPDEASGDEEDCGECEGTGTVGDDGPDCEQCGGTGTLEADADAVEEALGTWRDEAQDAIQAALDNSPV